MKAHPKEPAASICSICGQPHSAWGAAISAMHGDAIQRGDAAMTPERERTIRSMEDFERIFLPRTYRRKQQTKRIKELGWGVVMAEEALKKVRLGR